MADDATREAFLSQANIAVLSTIGPGGGPHAVPIWYLPAIDALDDELDPSGQELHSSQVCQQSTVVTQPSASRPGDCKYLHSL